MSNFPPEKKWVWLVKIDAFEPDDVFNGSEINIDEISEKH